MISSIAFGFLALGSGFVVLDLAVVMLMKRMYPDPAHWEDLLRSTELTSQQSNDIWRRKRLYLACVSHRFGKWGGALFLIGGLLFGVKLIIWN